MTGFTTSDHDRLDARAGVLAVVAIALHDLGVFGLLLLRMLVTTGTLGVYVPRGGTAHCACTKFAGCVGPAMEFVAEHLATVRKVTVLPFSLWHADCMRFPHRSNLS